jgi:hypothetical protein
LCVRAFYHTFTIFNLFKSNNENIANIKTTTIAINPCGSLTPRNSIGKIRYIRQSILQIRLKIITSLFFVNNLAKFIHARKRKANPIPINIWA